MAQVAMPVRKMAAHSASTENMRMPRTEVPKTMVARRAWSADDRAVVHVAPGEVAAAGEVVELVAEVAVAEVLRPEDGGDVQHEHQRRKDGGKAQRGAKRGVRWTDDGGGGHLDVRVRDVGRRSSDIYGWRTVGGADVAAVVAASRRGSGLERDLGRAHVAAGAGDVEAEIEIALRQVDELVVLQTTVVERGSRHRGEDIGDVVQQLAVGVIRDDGEGSAGCGPARRGRLRVETAGIDGPVDGVTQRMLELGGEVADAGRWGR